MLTMNRRLGDARQFAAYGHRLYESSMVNDFVCTCGHQARTIEEHDAHIVEVTRPVVKQ